MCIYSLSICWPVLLHLSDANPSSSVSAAYRCPVVYSPPCPSYSANNKSTWWQGVSRMAKRLSAPVALLSSCELSVHRHIWCRSGSRDASRSDSFTSEMLLSGIFSPVVYLCSSMIAACSGIWYQNQLFVHIYKHWLDFFSLNIMLDCVLVGQVITRFSNKQNLVAAHHSTLVWACR